MATLEQYRQQLAQFQHREGEAVVIVPSSRVNWLRRRDLLEVWFAGDWHKFRAEYVTGVGPHVALFARSGEQHQQFWELAVAASKLAPFDASALAMEVILPSGLKTTVSCNQEDALWGDSVSPARGKDRDYECRHDWRIFGPGIQENSLLVRCPQCSTVGKVVAPSAEEEARICDGPDPYRWPHNDRVKVLQAGSRFRRVRCNDCGCPAMALAESLSPGGIVEAEGNCPSCGYQYSMMEHVHKGTGSFWESWPVKIPVQTEDIERTFERLLGAAQTQFEEAKVRAIRRATGRSVPAAEQNAGVSAPLLSPPPSRHAGSAAVRALDLSSDPEFMAELDKLDNEAP